MSGEGIVVVNDTDAMQTWTEEAKMHSTPVNDPKRSDAFADQPDLQRVSDAILGHLPTMANDLADITGSLAPRLTHDDRKKFKRRLDRLIRRCAPLLQRVEQLKALPRSPANIENFKVTIRSLLDELMSSTRIKKGGDGLKKLVTIASQLAKTPRASWSRSPVYEEVRVVLCRFLLHIYEGSTLGHIHRAFDEIEPGYLRRYAHALRLFQVALSKARLNPPKRMTDRLAVELQQEYCQAASVFEQQLRILTYLARRVKGRAKPWPEWPKEGLNNLLAITNSNLILAPLAARVDLHVRNGLTHGPPIIRRTHRTCVFEDRGTSVCWSWEDYFERTRSLTITVLALSSFYTLQQMLEAQILASALAPSGKGSTIAS